MFGLDDFDVFNDLDVLVVLDVFDVLDLAKFVLTRSVLLNYTVAMEL